MSEVEKKTGEWKLHYESRNAESGLTIQLNRLENDDGLVLFSFRIGIRKENGAGGQFVPVRVKGRPGDRDINSWTTEINDLVMEVEEQVLLYFAKRDSEDGRTGKTKKVSQNSDG